MEVVVGLVFVIVSVNGDSVNADFNTVGEILVILISFRIHHFFVCFTFLSKYVYR